MARSLPPGKSLAMEIFLYYQAEAPSTDPIKKATIVVNFYLGTLHFDNRSVMRNARHLSSVLHTAANWENLIGQLRDWGSFAAENQSCKLIGMTSSLFSSFKIVYRQTGCVPIL
jgi:hypothetical protein